MAYLQKDLQTGLRKLWVMHWLLKMTQAALQVLQFTAHDHG